MNPNGTQKKSVFSRRETAHISENHSHPSKRQRTLHHSDPVSSSFSLSDVIGDVQYPTIAAQNRDIPKHRALGYTSLQSFEADGKSMPYHDFGHKRPDVGEYPHSIGPRAYNEPQIIDLMAVGTKKKIPSVSSVDLLSVGPTSPSSPASSVQWQDEPLDSKSSEGAVYWTDNSSSVSSSDHTALIQKSPMDVSDYSPYNSMLEYHQHIPKASEIGFHPSSIFMNQPNPEILNVGSSSMETITSTNHNTETRDRESTKQLEQEAQEEFKKFIPSLESVDRCNFCGVLSDVLREYNVHVPLDDLYQLLYNYDTPEETSSRNYEDQSNRKNRKALQICQLVLESFKTPQTAQVKPAQRLVLSSVNFHELSRNFLAMKIILGSLRKVEDRSKTIPRGSVYKAYYIICQNLIQKYPTISKSLSLQQNLILGQSKIGKLTNLVYTDLSTKRLGKRGQSKTQYIGLTWNESVLSDDILRLMDLDLTDIRDHFKDSRFNSSRHRKNTEHISEKVAKQEVNLVRKPKKKPVYEKPLYSFVNISATYPCSDFSPRIWTETANSVPKHSEWAKGTMERSLDILSNYNLDLSPLIESVHVGVFSNDLISQSVVYAMNTLLNGSAPKDIFLRLYLFILLLIFPVVISSDQEVSAASKSQLRASMVACVTKLETDFAGWPSVDNISLRTFTRIFRKMLILNEMSSSTIKPQFVKSVFKEMSLQVKFLENEVEHSENVSALDSMSFRGLIMALNAFNLEMSNLNPADSQMDSATTIFNLGKIISEEVMRSTKEMALAMNQKSVLPNVPFQVFKSHIGVFHKLTVSCQKVANLPIPVMSYLISNFTKEMQNASLQKFGKDDPELCKEAFKSWWVYSSMFEEYISVVSEVVALSQSLG